MPSLKASSIELDRIKHARKAKHWAIEDPRWLIAASQVLEAAIDWNSDPYVNQHIFASGVSLSTWKRFLRGEPINADVFKAFCQILGLDWQQIADRSPSPQGLGSAAVAADLPNGDAARRLSDSAWSDAIDVSIFYGRTTELTTLQRWIVHDRCRLVTLLGMGGMGKTSLSVKLAETVQGDFERLIWRSLRDAPPVQELLDKLIQVLTPQEANLPESVSGKLSHLLERLRTTRCLVVFDNFDAVLQDGKRAGTYRSGYEDYGELLRRIGEQVHQSCIVLTSREKPQEIGMLEGEQLPVRTLPLPSLDAIAGQHLLLAKGLTGSEREMQPLIEHYRGNPLALKIAATSIRDVFAGDTAAFLEHGATVFNGLATLLTQQYDRLSPLEQQVMIWLTVYREPVTPAHLYEGLVLEVSKPRLLEALESLKWRGLVETSAMGFTLQPAVMEYLSDRVVEQVHRELVELSNDRLPQSNEAPLLCSHALMQAQAQDYIRESQIRTIVQPLVDRLLIQFGSVQRVEAALQDGLRQLRTEASLSRSYAAGNLLNLFRQLGTDLTGYDVSGLDIRQAYLQDVTLHQVNFAHSTLSHCAFASTFGSITSVAFSPNGEQLAIGDTNGDIQVWSTIDQTPIATCRGHSGWVWSVAYSPTQPLLASAGQDHTIRLWNANTGDCLAILHGHTNIVTAIAFTPHGLVSSSYDRTVKLWDTATETCLTTFEGHDACVWSVCATPDGTIVSAGEDCTIKLWDRETGGCLKTLRGHSRWILSIALHPDGKTLVSGGFDRTIKCWNLQTGECVQTLHGHQHNITSVAVSVDGLLASGSYDQTVKLWDLQAGRCLQTLQKHTNHIWTIAFHPQKPVLASGGDDHSAKLWDLRTRECTKTLQGHSNGIFAIALNPITRDLVASGHEDQTVKLWRLDLQPDSSAQPYTTLRGHTDRVLSIAISPNGETIASSSADSTIKLWNWHGDCLATLHDHTSWVWSVAYRPDGRQLASGSYDQTVRLWDVQTGCVNTLRAHTSPVLAVAFSPDGTQLASGDYNHTIHLWNVQTGECVNTLNGHTGRIWSIAISPDGKWLASAGDDQTIKLWSLATGDCCKTLIGHTDHVLSVQFSLGGTAVITASADQTLKCWSVASGECLQTFAGHENLVWAGLECTRELLVSGSQDETIKLWNAQTGECIRTLRSLRPYEGLNLTQVKGLTDAQIGTLQALGAIALPDHALQRGL